jgi:hypothetical protein
MTKEEYFGDPELAAEYSVPGCTQTDSGYHCSCYEYGDRQCCMCGERNSNA